MDSASSELSSGGSGDETASLAHWHATPECFQCQICHKSLLGTKMTMKFGLVLCSSACAFRAGEIQAIQASAVQDQQLKQRLMQTDF